MSHSKCPKCGNTSFEAESVAVKNLNVYVIMIKCTSCNSVIGTFDAQLHDEVKKIKKSMGIN